jgi:hypothetical protein
MAPAATAMRTERNKPERDKERASPRKPVVFLPDNRLNRFSFM